MSDDPLGNAAHEEPVDPGPAVAADDDKVGAFFTRRTHDNPVGPTSEDQAFTDDVFSFGAFPCRLQG